MFPATENTRSEEADDAAIARYIAGRRGRHGKENRCRHHHSSSSLVLNEVDVGGDVSGDVAASRNLQCATGTDGVFVRIKHRDSVRTQDRPSALAEHVAVSYTHLTLPTILRV